MGKGGDAFRAALGLPRHAKCDPDNGCGQAIAEEGENYSQRWVRAPVYKQPGGTNKDGSPNMDDQACAGSDDGRHHPQTGTFW